MNNKSNKNVSKNTELLKKYWAIIVVVILIFVITSGLLVIVISNSGNKISSFKIALTNSSGVNTYGQKFTWVFTRPLPKNIIGSLSKFIVFKPAIAGNYRIIDSEISFIPNGPLLANTNYQIDISRDIKDNYGSSLVNGYHYTFTTTPERFIYTANDPDGKSDLVMATINSDNTLTKTTITTEQNIADYRSSYGGNLIAYTTVDSENSPTSLYLYKLSDQTTTKVELTPSYKITNMQFDRKDELVFLGTQYKSNLDKQAQDPNNFIAKPYKYSIADSKTEEIKVLQPYYGNIVDFYLTPDGNNILIHGFNYDYILVSLLNAKSAIVGNFQRFGQFNYSGDMIALSSFDSQDPSFTPRVRIYQATSNKYVSPPNLYTKDPALFSDGTKVAYSYKLKDLNYTEGIMGIAVTDITNLDKPAPLLQLALDGYSLDLSQVSNDAKYLIAEATDINILSNFGTKTRLYKNAGRPLHTDIHIYTLSNQDNLDSKTSRDILTIKDAYNVLWLN